MGLFDLSKFEKISEDQKTTTLRHKDGHEIRVVHQYIPRIQREQLKFLKMAEGGQVEEFEDEKYPEKADEKEHEEWLKRKGKERSKNHDKFMKKHEEIMSEGGRKKLARGGLAHYDEGTPDKPVSEDDQQAVQDQQGQTPDQSHTTNVYVGTQPSQPPAPAIAPGQSLQSTQPAQVSAPQMPQAPNVLLPDKSMNAPGVAQAQQEAIQTGGQLESQKQAAQVQYEQQALKERQRLADIDAQNYKELKQHTDDFRGYLQANPINPNHYMESRGSGQKMANAIGLFLGGLGGGVSGTGGNVALDYINKQIDRDIDAQKAKSEQQRTIWGAYRDLYGEGNIANNLAKVSMNDMLVHQTNLTAAQLGTVSALNAAKALGAAKAVENNKLILDSAGRLGSTQNVGKGTPAGPMASSQGAPAGQSNPPQAKNSHDLSTGASKSQGDQVLEQQKMDDHFLMPGADAALENEIKYGVKYRGPGEKLASGAMEQKRGAALADNALDAINETMPKLKTLSEDSGYTRRQSHLLAGVPVVGPFIEGVSKLASDTPQNRSYDSLYTRVSGAVRGALAGRVGAEELEGLLRKNAPEAGETSQSFKDKLETLKAYVYDHTPVDQLQTTNGVLNKKRKKR